MTETAIQSHQITQIINRLNENKAPLPTDIEVLTVYNELKKVARFHLSNNQSLKTLTPTVLVNEVFLKLYNKQSDKWQNRKHFYSTASKAIKHIIIDAARTKSAEKRSALSKADIELEQVEALNLNTQLKDALADLEKHDAFLYSVVELKFFIGLTSTEAAEVLECSRITVERAWKKAKNYLLDY